ncbi:MAG: glycosyltransferase family 4 protein [Candidatus Staskawiczbacteria bacterium]|nr:glycosyltransferase family 4 protein [Candidatus Staskawiczbacteria bacterium]
MNKKKIKICHVVSVEITIRFILFNILNFLKKEGYDVSVVCSPGNWIESIEKKGFKLKTIRFKRKVFSPFSDLLALVRLFFYFKKEKFDIVHTHTLKPEFYGQIAAKLAGVPIIVNTIHGFDFGDQTPALKKKFFIFLQKIAARCSDIVFAVSNLVAKTAVKEKICRPEQVRYWGGGVDVERFDPKRFSENFIAQKKKELGIDPSGMVVGIVARLVEEKGYFELFSAFRDVLKRFPNAVLVVIGQEEPEKKDAIRSDTAKDYKIQNNTLFLGERTDVDEIYPLMDVFVLPTHREGIGASILEASAMEKPVIASNTGGCPEAVDDKKTGILVPVKNVEKLSQAIIYLLNNPFYARELGQAGREKIIKSFDERLIFDRIKKEYERLILKKNI